MNLFIEIRTMLALAGFRRSTYNGPLVLIHGVESRDDHKPADNSQK